MNYPKIASLKTAEQFLDHLKHLGISLPFDKQVDSGKEASLAKPFKLSNGFTIGNRFSVLPMEGWDGTKAGRPTDDTMRRWKRFGQSGAKLIWGGEAVAVRHDGRASPNQLMISARNVGDIAALRERLVEAHRQSFGNSDDLLVGLQLTHSGRFARPNRWEVLEPKILYRHAVLDRKFKLNDATPIFTDDQVKRLIDDFTAAAKLAHQAGFTFVDIKHCHGYLGHEFLSAIDRRGHYGGTFENRTRFLRETTAAIRSEVPGLDVAVRVSAFDFVPFRKGPDAIGEPDRVEADHYSYGFGCDLTGTGIELTEPYAFLDLLAELDIQLVCISAGSPYYNPHIQRPAYFPPSDGYLPPEDPLVGVARQIEVTAKLKQHRPELLIVGSGYSYLQEWLPHVAQPVVASGMADFIGVGRMVLSYPELVADVLAGRSLQRKLICRTFSDCTTSPRVGMVSGCYPLDDYYKSKPDATKLKEIKKEAVPVARKVSTG